MLGYLNEVTSGLTSVRDASTLLEQAENDWNAIQTRLENIRTKIVSKKSNLIINLSADKKTLEVAKNEYSKIVTKLPTNPVSNKEKSIAEEWKTNSKSLLLPMQNEGFTMPSQVNYVCKGGPIYQPNEPISASTTVVSRYLSLRYLWDNVRVVGGAYGGFARFSEVSGRMMFMSYRDPNLKNTLDIYDGAGPALKQAEITEQDILQVCVCVI